VTKDWLRCSGVELAAEIKAHTVSAREVVAAHIAHIQRVNPRLNAMVQERFSVAMAEAVAADAALAHGSGPLPPFLGVPCSIKECFSFTGFANTSGLIARRDRLASRDATAVARYRTAGAIPLGITNVSELCMWMESSNPLYGRTNNPYDLRRTVGGSSGGEAAIIAAGGAPFGLGSDIGGSIRMPAFFNGIFGHKPSGGLVPGTGQHPIAVNEALRYLCTGPLARRAEDLFPLLEILAGPDGEDASVLSLSLSDPRTVSFDGMSVLVVEDNGQTPVEPILVDGLHRAAQALEQRGAVVKPQRFAGLRKSFAIWASMLSAAGGPSFAALMGDDGPAVRPLRELLRWLLGRSAHSFPAIGLALTEHLTKLTPRRSARFLAMGKALREEVQSTIGDGLMLFPPYPTRAPLHGRALLPPFQWVYTGILNMMEVPVTQVPLGLCPEGLPLGVQVVANHGQDHRSIAAALILEEAFGGWTPPPIFYGSHGAPAAHHAA